MASKPNIIVICTDQQRWDTLGCYGNPMAITPNLDRMANEGTLFQHAFTPHPRCAPARRCIESGRFDTTISGVEYIHSNPNTLSHTLSRAGYDVGYVGKWHIGGENGPVSADRRGGYQDHWLGGHVVEMTTHPYEGLLWDETNEPVRFAGYRVDAFVDYGLEYIREVAHNDDPFFLFLSLLEPHHQNDLADYVAPDGYARQFADPWVPPDLKERSGRWHSQLPDYYGICARIDECIGRVRSELSELGIEDDTVLWFTSDHGCQFETRSGTKKEVPHESAIRIPSLVVGPEFNNGGRIEELVSHIDLAPTLLDAAGIEPPESMHGRSMLPLSHGDDATWRDAILIETETFEQGRALRTDRWKYIVYDPDNCPENESVYVEKELYDLAVDPTERDNRIRSAPEISGQLRNQLLTRLSELGEDATIIQQENA